MNIIKQLDSLLSSVNFDQALKYTRFRRDLSPKIDDYLTNMFGFKQGVKNPDKSYKVQRIFIPTDIKMNADTVELSETIEKNHKMSEADVFLYVR